MRCNDCGGILMVINVHDEKDVTRNRLCDVQCMDCEKVLYYQPYDFGNRLNVAKEGNK